MAMTSCPTDPTTLRSEARDIEIGAPDGDGYAGWLRSCADRIEALQLALAVSMRAHAENTPGDSRAVPDWVAACAMVEAGNASEENIACLREALARTEPEEEEMAP